MRARRARCSLRPQRCDVLALQVMPPLSPEKPALCAGCGGKISDRYYLLAVDKQWHLRCLKCCECKLALESELTCFAKDGSIYCKEDYYRYPRPHPLRLGTPGGATHPSPRASSPYPSFRPFGVRLSAPRPGKSTAHAFKPSHPAKGGEDGWVEHQVQALPVTITHSGTFTAQ